MEIPEPIRRDGCRIWRVVNRTFPSNSYLCATGEADECFLVDPGTDPDAIAAVLAAEGLTLRHIFCTHGHFDHAGSAAVFQERHRASCYLHGGDTRTLRASNFLMMALKVPFVMKQPQVQEAEGLAMTIGGRELRFLAAPGHTPGSCLVQYGTVFFTGDTLYAFGVGLSGVPGQAPDQLKATLLDLWGRLPEDALVLPGHGEGASFGTIRRSNLPLLRFLGLPEPTTGEDGP